MKMEARPSDEITSLIGAVDEIEVIQSAARCQMLTVRVLGLEIVWFCRALSHVRRSRRSNDRVCLMNAFWVFRVGTIVAPAVLSSTC